MPHHTFHIGDALTVLRGMEPESVNCCVTSPPYFGLRSYLDRDHPDKAQEIGTEAYLEAYVSALVEVFREVRRVLRADGTLWLNLGDSYAHPNTGGNGATGGRDKSTLASRMPTSGTTPTRKSMPADCKPKDLIGVPWRVAFALQADGWWLRSDIVWAKLNPMPESVTDRPTRSHEFVFLLAKSQRYYYDAEAIKEPCKVGDNGSYFDAGKTAHHENQGKDKRDKQRSLGKPTYAGCNDRYDAKPVSTANKRDVWTIGTEPFAEAHFAVMPTALVEPCIRAGCPPTRKCCDCAEVIETPTGSGHGEDPSAVTGRAGFNRPRQPNEGSRPVTRREQRWEAEQIKQSPYKESMRHLCGDAFDHYIRTDRSGARPLPPSIRQEFFARGWITEAPPCDHPTEDAGVVLDPFGGSGTVSLVAKRLGRSSVYIDLNPAYADLAVRRCDFAQQTLHVQHTHEVVRMRGEEAGE